MRLGNVKVSLHNGADFSPLHPNTVVLKEAGIYCFLLRCKKAEAESFLKWVTETVLPSEVRKLTEEKNQIIEEKDTQLALLNDDLTEAQKHSRQLELNNTGLQGEIKAKDKEIALLHKRYVPPAKNRGKDNLIMIYRKHTDGSDKFFHLPYYAARIQRQKISTKRRWLLEQFPLSEEIVVLDNPNSVHAFNRFEEEGHIERHDCHFRLVDLTRQDLYDLGVPPIEV